jgi:predicted acyltransferase
VPCSEHTVRIRTFVLTHWQNSYVCTSTASELSTVDEVHSLVAVLGVLQRIITAYTLVVLKYYISGTEVLGVLQRIITAYTLVALKYYKPSN